MFNVNSYLIASRLKKQNAIHKLYPHKILDLSSIHFMFKEAVKVPQNMAFRCIHKLYISEVPVFYPFENSITYPILTCRRTAEYLKISDVL